MANADPAPALHKHQQTSRGPSKAPSFALAIRHLRVAALVVFSTLIATGCDSASQPSDDAATVSESPTEDRSKLVFVESVTADQWKSVAESLPPVERLEFLAEGQPDLDWSLLQKPLKLTRFRFNGSASAGLADALSNREELTLLNLPNTTWDDSQAAFIGDLSNLTLLRIGGNGLTDVSVELFANRLTKLRHLHLIDVAMSDQSLEAIAANNSIESLYLDGVNVSDAALSDLIKQRPDIHLHLNQLHLPSDPRQD